MVAELAQVFPKLGTGPSSTDGGDPAAWDPSRLAALVARRPEWRRLGLGTGAAALATALFTAYSYLLGLPTVTDW